MTVTSLWHSSIMTKRSRTRASSHGSLSSSPNPGSASPERRHVQPSRKRASKPKVRTGCINCKHRHLKCDERKPSCFRCQDFGIPCQGYATTKAGGKGGGQLSTRRFQRALLPRPESRYGTAAGTIPTGRLHGKAENAVVEPVQVPPLVLCSPPPIIPHLGAEDAHYLSFYSLEVAQHLSPQYPSRFWTGISLRESSRNECILHAVLSIGAYGRAVEEARGYLSRHLASNGSSTWLDARRNRHHEAALQHYSKAIRLLQGNLGTCSDSRLAMMATLLFLVLENMQGNSHAVGSLIRSGIKVLGSLWPRETTDKPVSDASQPPQRVLSRPPSQRHIERTSSPGSSCSSASSPSWRPPSLKRLEGSPAGDLDGETTEMAQMYARHSTAGLLMPFPHCKSAFHMLLDPRLPSDKPSRPHPEMQQPATIAQAQVVWDFYLPGLANFFQKCTWHNFNVGYDFDTPNAVREQSERLAWLGSFGATWHRLRTTHCVKTQSGEKVTGAASGLLLLSLQHAAATVFTRCCLDPCELKYDTEIEQFRDIISGCRDLASNMVGNPSVQTCQGSRRPLDRLDRPFFTNDAGILPIIGFVACKCRDRRVRQDALSLLEQCEWREGSWDSGRLRSVIRTLMELEEAGMDHDSQLVPPSARFAWTNAWCDLQARTVKLEFTRLLPGADGEYQKTDVWCEL